MNESTSGFCELRHTADSAVLIWAKTVEDLFVEAAWAFYAVFLLGSKPVSPDVECSIALEALDIESLLVAFLSELLFFAEQEGISFDIHELKLNGFKLTAKLTSRTIIAIKNEIKAVTYHDLMIERTQEGYRTRVVFDL